MSKQPNKPGSLRAEAEARLACAPPADGTQSSPEEILHELRVYQIELEMQNDALRQTQLELEESRDRYVDLYDFAPIGYLTLTRSGLIREVNLTGALLLGMERNKLAHRRFAQFVAPEDSERWHQHFVRVVQYGGQRDCELSLKRGDGSVFHAHLDCLRVDVGSEFSVRIAFADITGRKRAEEELRIAAIAFESQEGMIVTDTKGVIVRVNQAFTSLTGYSAAEAVGQTPALLGSGRTTRRSTSGCGRP